MTSLTSLLGEVRACTICAAHLPHEPRPILQVHARARILIVGQAPGRKAHASGVPFNDASGDRLREWMGVTPAVLHDARQIAILPMGFCYPGAGRSGDLPPRPECAAAWRARLLGHLRSVQFTLVIGQYAQACHMDGAVAPLTELVRAWRDYWPDIMPLPHPSPRNNLWLRRNSWFETEVIPALRKRVRKVLG